MWYLIVSIPDLCTLTYLGYSLLFNLSIFFATVAGVTLIEGYEIINWQYVLQAMFLANLCNMLLEKCV